MRSPEERSSSVNSRSKYRLLAVCLAAVAILFGLLWISQTKNHIKQLSQPSGPRLKADPLEGNSEFGDNSFQLPTEPEAIEMAKLQDEMIGQANHLASFYPRTAAALDLAASVHYDLNRLDEADRLWKACLELSPREPDYYVQYAKYLVNLDRAEEAVSVITNAHAKAIETAGTYHLLATAYERVGQTEKAGEISEEVNRRFPEFADSWLLTGKIQNQLGKFSDAQKSLQRSLELGQAEGEVWPVLIPVLARLGDRQEAVELKSKMKNLQESMKAVDADGKPAAFQLKFEESLRSRAVRMYQLAAMIEKQAWNTNEAVRLVSRSIELEPTNPASLVLLAELLIEANRTNDAIVAYQRLVEIQPENVVNFTNLAGLALREKKPQLAARTLEAGVQSHPDLLGLQIPLAKVYMELGKPREAREIVSKILETQANPEAMMILGASYQLTGNKEQAVEAFEKARSMTVDSILK